MKKFRFLVAMATVSVSLFVGMTSINAQSSLGVPLTALQSNLAYYSLPNWLYRFIAYREEAVGDEKLIKWLKNPARELGAMQLYKFIDGVYMCFKETIYHVSTEEIHRWRDRYIGYIIKEDLINRFEGTYLIEVIEGLIIKTFVIRTKNGDYIIVSEIDHVREDVEVISYKRLALSIYQKQAIEHKKSTETTLNDEDVYDNVEVEAIFPGGNKEITTWLAKNISYTPVAAEQGIQGKVILRFVVEKDGSIGEVQILRPLNPGLDAEALRVVKKMPRWTPGKNNGEPVRVWFNLPITFNLE